ncbi:hypothetical protein AJ78_05373 [Emergomyces pasteurianus Ep9510]|uniref:Uncharacterized protein n=1 Tax=Emergomyces pasteurianus Ep9510 TaxID=1447872 RepID=A0A1J9QDQ2_9EURO|nr:hypothetical protein AJ78_05373 [Emergomyces pasteurianus Ep9510]
MDTFQPLGRTERQRRRHAKREARRRLKLSDSEVRLILQQMQSSRSLRLYEHLDFVRQFVKAPWITDEEAAEVLWDYVHFYFVKVLRESGCKGLTETLSYCKGNDCGEGQIIIYWRDQYPELPPLIADSPIFCLEESDYNPDEDSLQNNNTPEIKPRSKLLPEPNPVNPDAVNFGTLGFIVTLDTGWETKFLATQDIQWKPRDVNCHEIVGSPSDAKDNRHIERSPSSGNPEDLNEWLKTNGPLTVYKQGASTGLTKGFLTHIKVDTRGLAQLLSRRRLTCLSSSPLSSSSSISTPEQDETMPLGILYVPDGDVSMAYLLHSWFTEIEFILDCDAYFCDPAQCELALARSSAFLQPHSTRETTTVECE